MAPKLPHRRVPCAKGEHGSSFPAENCDVSFSGNTDNFAEVYTSNAVSTEITKIQPEYEQSPHTCLDRLLRKDDRQNEQDAEQSHLGQPHSSEPQWRLTD